MKLEEGVGGRRGGGGEERVGLRPFVRPYLRPDDRCRGPSLDKLSCVPSLPPRCQSVYSTALSVCLYSILVPPPISVSVARARASSFGTGFEWTANTRAPSGGGASNRAETERKTKKNRPDPRCQLFQPRWRTFLPNVFSPIKDKDVSRRKVQRIEESIYKRWCEKLRKRDQKKVRILIVLMLRSSRRRENREREKEIWKIENRTVP